MKNLLLAGALTLAAGTASAATIDFDGLSGDISGIDLGGVSLNTGQITTPANQPNGTPGILASGFDFTLQFIATFLVDDINSVSVDMGDTGADADDLFLQAFDAFDNMIGSTTGFLPAGVAGMETLSLTTVTDISYVVFFAEGLNGENNVIADNLVFESVVSEVPLPAAGLMLLGGLGAFGALRRRKSA